MLTKDSRAFDMLKPAPDEIEILRSLEKYYKETMKLLISPSFSPDIESPLRNLFIEPELESENGEVLIPSKYHFDNKKMIIIGMAGCGKTTLLKYFAGVLWDKYLEFPTKNAIPFFIPFRKIGSDTFPMVMFKTIYTYIENFKSLTYANSGQIFDNVINKFFESNRIFFLIDALDEIETSERVLVFSRILELSKRYPNLQLIITTRPTATRDYFTDFKKFYLKPFNEEQIGNYIKRVLHSL